LNTRTKQTDIGEKTRATVHDRDRRRCVYCGRVNKPIELAHYISRAQGGLGIPQNLISLCMDCHGEYDGERRRKMQGYLAGYLQAAYPGWNESGLVYRKE
jgi:5-methylcytosine-specific restriction endonuclease McrA